MVLPDRSIEAAKQLSMECGIGSRGKGGQTRALSLRGEFISASVSGVASRPYSLCYKGLRVFGSRSVLKEQRGCLSDKSGGWDGLGPEDRDVRDGN